MAPKPSCSVQSSTNAVQERTTSTFVKLNESEKKQVGSSATQQKKVPPVRIKLTETMQLRKSTRARRPKILSSSEDESELESAIPDEEPGDSSEEEVETNVEGLSAAERGLELKVVNVQVKCHFKVPLDVLHIARHARNTEHNPRRRAGVLLRFRRPSVTAALYHSGRATIQGGQNTSEMEYAAQKLKRLLHKLGYDDAAVHDYKVSQMIATCDVKQGVQLDKMAVLHHIATYYEPELSPKLDYFLESPKVTITVYASGNLKFTGAKSLTDLQTALEHILPILDSCHRKQRY